MNSLEDLVERENTFTMEEFAKSINEFLEFRRYDILKDNGKISRKEAEEKAERAVQFRKWANQIVKDYTIKGWVMEDDRLKNDGSILT